MEESSSEEDEKENKTINELNINLTNVMKSVCKIIYLDKESTGTLIKLYKDEKELNCLITIEHLISKEMIELNKIIEVKYNSEKKLIKIKLDKNERYIIYNKEMDITIIEIKNDEIKDKYFLLSDLDNNLDYINKDIYIFQYRENNKIKYAEGKIKNININEIIYDSNTEYILSGGPILIKNINKVIGINKHKNNGLLIYSIMQLINNKQFMKKIYKNGNYYIGEMLNGIPHGKGIIYYKNGNILYDGDFVNDKAEGNGKYINENGDYYIGEFLNDKPHTTW